jgi:hypothetical protein
MAKDTAKKDGASKGAKQEGFIQLRNVRLSFPHLWEAAGIGNDPNSAPRYSANFLIAKDDKKNLGVLKKGVKKLLAEKFGGKRLPDERMPMHDGDDKEYSGYSGHIFVSTARNESQGRPTVLDRDKTQLAPGDGRPYAGCFVDAILRLYSIGGEGDRKSAYGKRICASLEAVRFRGDGERFGGGITATEAGGLFDDLDDEDDEDDDGDDLLD